MHPKRVLSNGTFMAGPKYLIKPPRTDAQSSGRRSPFSGDTFVVKPKKPLDVSLETVRTSAELVVVSSAN